MAKKGESFNLTKELTVSLGACPDFTCEDDSHHKAGVTNEMSAEEADRVRAVLEAAVRDLEAYSTKLRKKKDKR